MKRLSRPASRLLGFQVKALFKGSWLFGWHPLRPRATSPTYLPDEDVLDIVPKEFKHTHNFGARRSLIFGIEFTRKHTDALASVAHSATDRSLFREI